MEGQCGPTAGCGLRWWGAGEEPLDRALVAGLMLDAALEAAPWPRDPQAQGRTLKIRVQEALLSYLAGRITLDRFHTLINILERSFSYYFPLVTSLLPRPARPPAAIQAAPGVPGSRAVSGGLLAEALAIQKIIPKRPRSKLTGPKLQDFLYGTGGIWFRLRDFQEHFGVDRKTAWEYVQKFLQAGLLVHNLGRAAAVRYGLADRFLKTRATAIRQEVAAALADLPSPLAPQVADRLIASGGEPFWEQEWRRLLPAAHSREIIDRLTATRSLLDVVCCADGKNRLLRLQERWLRSP
jgi:hypothetical protein